MSGSLSNKMIAVDQTATDPEGLGRIKPWQHVDGEKVLEKGDNSVTLAFSVPGDSHYFDGHFPNFPLLPGAAQVELVVRFASRYFGTDVDVSGIKRVKFTNFVKPCAPLVLKLEKEGAAISFAMHSPDGGTSYSSGTVTIRDSIKRGE